MTRMSDGRKNVKNFRITITGDVENKSALFICGNWFHFSEIIREKQQKVN